MKQLTWREALQAMAVDARRRAENSKPMASGPTDPITVAQKNGARWAFGVMADEMKYLGDASPMGCPSREALERLRKLLGRTS